MQEGNSMSRPPFFDGTNYSQWKMMMRIFIKSIDERAWRSILTGWSPPTIKDENGKEITRPEIHWTNDERKISGYNSKALYAIFCAVDMNQFKLISTCTTAKEAWKILRGAFEGTRKDRLLKLRELALRFEYLRMEVDETIWSFFGKLCDIANEAHALGEPYNSESLVRKVLRSLPERFACKVAVTEEARDLMTLKLEELICSLQAFEMNLAQQKGEKIPQRIVGAL